MSVFCLPLPWSTVYPQLAGQYPELRGTGTRVVVNILYAEQEDNRQKGGES